MYTHIPLQIYVFRERERERERELHHYTDCIKKTTHKEHLTTKTCQEDIPYHIIYIIKGEFCQRQVLHCKRRNLGCSSAEGKSSTTNSGTKAAVLQGNE